MRNSKKKSRGAEESGFVLLIMVGSSLIYCTYQALLDIGDVLLHWSVPIPTIGFIEGINFAPIGDFHIGMGQDKFPNPFIEGEAVHATADRKDERRGTTVQTIPRRHEIIPGL